MKKTLTLPLVLSSMLLGAGYQVPNNSVNSAALATAYVANANGADSAYYNPANMIYNEDKHQIEASLTHVSLSSINYKSSNGAYDINSKKHTTLIPSLNYVSNKLSDSGVRIGFSIASAYGSTREWGDFPAVPSAEKFSLKTIEFNPSVAIPLNDKISLGLGFRYIRAEGEVKLDGSMLPFPNNFAVDMQGKDNSSFGYNLALSYKPNDALNLSATYRSRVTLEIDGDADVTTALGSVSTGASLEVPLPANLILAAAYTFDTGTTLEITYDRTMWSAVKEINFNYDNPVIEGSSLGASKARKWHDSYAYRVGVTHQLNEAVILMGGIAYSTNPANDAYVSYSSPEADSMTYALGGRYKVNDSMELGLAVLYADYEDRTVSQTVATGLEVNGRFSNRDALTITAGLAYKF